MNIFTKTLLVSALALAATSAAEARIATAGNNTADGGELFLNVWNSTDEVSYTLDTGLTVGNFMAGRAGGFTFNLNTLNGATDSNFASFISSYAVGDVVTWGLGSGILKMDVLEDAPAFGLYETVSPLTPVTATTLPFFNDIGAAAFGLGNVIGAVNTANDEAINDSSFASVGQDAYTGGFLNNNGLGNFDNQGDLGDLGFYHFGVDHVDADTGTLALLGKWNLAFTNGAGTLTYTNDAPSAVPLPAAVWMFGAGLMGVLRLNRRKSMAA